MAVARIDLTADFLYESSQLILDVGYNRILRRFH
jgi:hypothetical protein